MPLRKKEEVCGKPTQYNLQTCEYNWKYLPDTHFNLDKTPRSKSRQQVYSKALSDASNQTPREMIHQLPPLPLPSPRSTGFTVVSPAPSQPVGLPFVAASPQAHVIPWSHDELRRLVYANQMEAQNSHLRSCR
ncbi:hypothetical protein DQ04_08551030 [Trypanosoma grayi]|uniref:hypothetical protein n=1 Tax=Trypanosoma grayi TaxID=71804 RepID=UPI0004F4B9ED|nr:hypothetical protein DQ04_08551030 [Trypanosoma grayi]KEG07890.1 hypothetical protein DQ04_08551030 [Trypanosoma grayi]